MPVLVSYMYLYVYLLLSNPSVPFTHTPTCTLSVPDYTFTCTCTCTCTCACSWPAHVPVPAHVLVVPYVGVLMLQFLLIMLPVLIKNPTPINWSRVYILCAFFNFLFSRKKKLAFITYLLPDFNSSFLISLLVFQCAYDEEICLHITSTF
jgi:hypothetical protein